MSSKKIAIFGAGGHGRVVSEIVELQHRYAVHFFDDDSSLSSVSGKYPVVGNLKDLLNDIDSYDGVHVAIGDNQIRSLVFRSIPPRQLISLVHPSAILSSRVKLGDGICIGAGAIINCGVTVGRGVIVNTGVIIDHDCHLGEFVHLCPRVTLAGGVLVGDYSFIGVGSSVIPRKAVGRHAIVGAGSSVIHNVAESTCVTGNPAKMRDNI